jgi:hypothetical protein
VRTLSRYTSHLHCTGYWRAITSDHIYAGTGRALGGSLTKFGPRLIHLADSLVTALHRNIGLALPDFDLIFRLVHVHVGLVERCQDNGL